MNDENVIMLDTTLAEYRNAAWVADSLIEEFLYLEGEATYCKAIMDMSVSEYLQFANAERFSKIKIMQLIDLFCKFSEQADPEEQTVKL